MVESKIGSYFFSVDKSGVLSFSWKVVLSSISVSFLPLLVFDLYSWSSYILCGCTWSLSYYGGQINCMCTNRNGDCIKFLLGLCLSFLSYDHLGLWFKYYSMHHWCMCYQRWQKSLVHYLKRKLNKMFKDSKNTRINLLWVSTTVQLIEKISNRFRTEILTIRLTVAWLRWKSVCKSVFQAISHQ